MGDPITRTNRLTGDALADCRREPGVSKRTQCERLVRDCGSAFAGGAAQAVFTKGAKELFTAKSLGSCLRFAKRIARRGWSDVALRSRQPRVQAKKLDFRNAAFLDGARIRTLILLPHAAPGGRAQPTSESIVDIHRPSGLDVACRLKTVAGSPQQVRAKVEQCTLHSDGILRMIIPVSPQAEARIAQMGAELQEQSAATAIDMQVAQRRLRQISSGALVRGGYIVFVDKTRDDLFQFQTRCSARQKLAPLGSAFTRERFGPEHCPDLTLEMTARSNLLEEAAKELGMPMARMGIGKFRGRGLASIAQGWSIAGAESPLMQAFNLANDPQRLDVITRYRDGTAIIEIDAQGVEETFTAPAQR